MMTVGDHETDPVRAKQLATGVYDPLLVPEAADGLSEASAELIEAGTIDSTEMPQSDADITLAKAEWAARLALGRDVTVDLGEYREALRVVDRLANCLVDKLGESETDSPAANTTANSSGIEPRPLTERERQRLATDIYAIWIEGQLSSAPDKIWSRSDLYAAGYGLVGNNSDRLPDAIQQQFADRMRKLVRSGRVVVLGGAQGPTRGYQLRKTVGSNDSATGTASEPAAARASVGTVLRGSTSLDVGGPSTPDIAVAPTVGARAELTATERPQVPEEAAEVQRFDLNRYKTYWGGTVVSNDGELRVQVDDELSPELDGKPATLLCVMICAPHVRGVIKIRKILEDLGEYTEWGPFMAAVNRLETQLNLPKQPKRIIFEPGSRDSRDWQLRTTGTRNLTPAEIKEWLALLGFAAENIEVAVQGLAYSGR